MLTSSSMNSIQRELIVLRKECTPTNAQQEYATGERCTGYSIRRKPSKETPSLREALPQTTRDFSRSGLCDLNTYKAPWVNSEQETWLANGSEQNARYITQTTNFLFSHTHMRFIDNVSCSQAGIELLIFLPPTPKHGLASSSHLLDPKTSELGSAYCQAEPV